jgi:hypothetical protein
MVLEGRWCNPQRPRFLGRIVSCGCWCADPRRTALVNEQYEVLDWYRTWF